MKRKNLALSLFSAFSFLLFQNCGETGALKPTEGTGSTSGTSYCDLASTQDPICRSAPQPVCKFNGVTIDENESVTAYLNSSEASGGICQSENRICIGGVLTGTYNFASCGLDAPKSCLFDGQTLASGSSVLAFLSASVPFGSPCTSQTRICDNGALSGAFGYAHCEPDAPAACLFDGRSVAHGNSVSAFEKSTVPFGESCLPQVRACYNGALDGVGEFGSCAVGLPASCLFDGRTIASGQQVIAYSESAVPYGQICDPMLRTCTNGVLSGNGGYGSCVVNEPASCLINNQTIPSSGTVTLYLEQTVPYGGNCRTEVRTCANGVLSGSAQYGSCAVDPAP
ncbi:MAG: hypothetical protein K2X47_14080, partial [Bdellovibrionales bacterium]|nr:hypothetical protein [Bdellovibrionales bacterium]